MGEVPLRIYPGGIETRIAWREVPGKKKKDASSPVGTGPLFSCFQALRAKLLSFGPLGQDTLFHCRIFPRVVLIELALQFEAVGEATQLLLHGTGDIQKQDRRLKAGVAPFNALTAHDDPG